MASYDTYNAASLRQILEGLERRYGLRSPEFMEAYASDDEAVLADIPSFTRHAWADVYDEWTEVATASDGFAEHVERELALSP